MEAAGGRGAGKSNSAVEKADKYYLSLDQSQYQLISQFGVMFPDVM